MTSAERSNRTIRWLAVLCTAVLVAGVSAASAAKAPPPRPDRPGRAAPQAQAQPVPPRADAPDRGALGLSLDRLLGGVLDPGDLLGTAGIGRLRVPGGVRVMVLSSGIGKDTFGNGWSSRLTAQGGDDKMGLGTFATSVLFQIAPQAKVTSINVYDGEKVNWATVAGALHWAAEHPKDLDAVLLAFPPAEMLDPESAEMAGGTWPQASDANDPASGRLARLADGWAHLRKDLGVLGDAGVAVVAPAGDLGPAPQSVLGIAGLPEVVAVGAAAGTGMVPVSAGGPSVYGRVKPDLAAPAGVPGLVPGDSVMATVLDSAGRVGPVPPLDLPIPAAGGRAALLGSTLPAAAVVVATTGQLHLDGIGDAATLRGLLTAAAVPLPGVPVWRQGAGLLVESPRADLARTRPLVGGAPDLGPEPAAGRDWATEVPVLGGRLAGPATVSFPWRVATTARGGREAVDAPVGGQPHPEATATTGGFRLSLPAGDNPWAPGAWCGYIHLPLAGLTEVLEDVPACLVEGLHLTAFNFYIHDMAAENLTFALIPALPPGAGLLDGPLMVLPLDPVHEPLLAGVSGPDGLVHFANVPPAFFVMRQFSDYGSPVTEELPARDGGKPKVHAGDLGEEASYLNFDALVLPNPCPERMQDHWTTGTPCHQAWLEQRFGPGSVRYDRTTARYFVTTPAGEMGVVFDFTKKSPGTAVTSRYVDLLAHGDLEDGSAVSLGRLSQSTLDGLGLHLAPAWTFRDARPSGDPEGTLATYKGGDAEHQPWSLVGASTYPFALTTPNYRGTMSLNFGYRLDDALVAVIVRVGEQVRTAIVSPQGVFELPPLGPAGNAPAEQAARLRQLLAGARPPGLPPETDPRQPTPFGAAVGQANLTFDLQPGGADHGTLAFLYVPINPLRPAAVHLSDRSFELTTWQRIDWPPAMMPRGGAHVMGHAFSFDSHYRPQQMNHPACRRVDNGVSAADVCENWQVLVHSPIDDAETFDLVDGNGGQSFLTDAAAGGAGLHNPHRGVHGDRAALEVNGLTLPLGRGVVTNGRFWEQLVIPAAVLAAHPGPVEVRLEDNQPGGRSPLFQHTDGPVGLAPYVAFVSWHRRLDTSLLAEIPQLRTGTQAPAVPLAPAPPGGRSSPSAPSAPPSAVWERLFPG